MAKWLEEYMLALESRDGREKADSAVFNACSWLPPIWNAFQPVLTAHIDTRLADRAAHLTPSKVPATESSPALVPSIRPSGIKNPVISPTSDPNNLVANLTAAQAARAGLEAKLSSLQTSHTSTVSQLSTLRSVHSQLTSQHTSLQTRFRDRESELRGKAKLLENLQDELATTEMELTVQSQQMDKLRDENRVLVERWMKRVAGEADEMNVALESGTRREHRRVDSTE